MTRAETVVWGVVALALGGVIAFAFVVRRPAEPPAPAAEPEHSSSDEPELAGEAPVSKSGLLPAPGPELGDHPTVEASGREVSTSELRGRFVVADFIFTQCGGPCPGMTVRMKSLQDELKSVDDVRLVSFTVDPERDSPEALASYAKNYGADPARWLFLRAEMDVIRDIAYERMRLVKDRKDLFIHSSKFVLLDREGRMRGLYSPLDDRKWMEKLFADLETLRKEPS